MSAADQGAGPGRWDNLRREALVAAGLVAGFVIVYLPGILLNTIGTPDDHKIFWVGDSKECCFSAWDSQNWAYIGRALGGLIANIQFGFIHELSDLAPVRIFSAIWTALGCFTIYLYLRRELPMVPALMVAVGICMVPAFFLGIIWAHAFAFLTVPPFLAFWAGAIAVDRPGFLGGRVGSALIAGLIFIATLYMYQPSAMFFVLPMVLTILFFRKFPEESILPRTIWVIGIFVVASAIYYAVHRYIFLPKFIAAYPNWADESSHARFVLLGAEGIAGLLPALARKFNDFSTMTLIAFNGLWPVPLRSLAIAVALTILCGVLFFGLRDREEGELTRRFTWQSVLATSILAILTTAPTIAAAGGYTPVRIASAYAAIVVAVFLWALFRACVGRRWAIATLAIIAALALLPLIQNFASLSNATARVTYDTVKAQLATNIDHPLNTVWIVGPEQRSNNPFGLTAGHEITSVTVSKLSVDLILADLGYRHGYNYKYKEVRSISQVIAFSERDALIDLRFLDRSVPNAFDRFRLAESTRIEVTEGRCNLAAANNLAPSLDRPGWTSSNVVIQPMPSVDTGVRAQVAGTEPLQRLSRRLTLPHGKAGDRLRVRISIHPDKGVDRTGLRFTLLPDVAQIFADAAVASSKWQCADITFVAPVGFELGDFYIYPTTTASDRGPARPDLIASLADLQVTHLPRERQTDLMPPRRLWRLRSVDRSAEAVVGATYLLDGRPETIWKVRGRPTADLVLELPEAQATLTGIHLNAPATKVINPPTKVEISGSNDGITWISLVSANISLGANRSDPYIVSIPRARSFRLISLTFDGTGLDWGLGDINPEFLWN